MDWVGSRRRVAPLARSPLSCPRRAAMANSRGGGALLRLRLLRSPISRCACLLLAFAALVLLASLRQVARVDPARPDPPRQARFVIPLPPLSTAITVSSLGLVRRAYFSRTQCRWWFSQNMLLLCCAHLVSYSRFLSSVGAGYNSPKFVSVVDGTARWYVAMVNILRSFFMMSKIFRLPDTYSSER
jgi:hypothetical protein